MNDGFLRQRRNLMAISIGLLLFLLAEGNIKTLFGVELGNKSIAILFAWLAFFYANWRYYIYLPKDWNISLESEICNSLKTDSFYQARARQALINNNLVNKEILETIETSISEFFTKENNKYNYHISFNDKFIGDFKGGNIPCENRFISTIIRLRTWLGSIKNGKVFSDYFIPIYLSEITFFTGIIYAQSKYQSSSLVTTLIYFLYFIALTYLLIVLIRPRLCGQWKNNANKALQPTSPITRRRG
jgi:hypothetical protein